MPGSLCIVGLAMVAGLGRQTRVFGAMVAAMALWGGPLAERACAAPPRVTHAVLVHGIWQNEYSGFLFLRRDLERRGVTCLVPSLKPADGRDGLMPLARQLKEEIERAFGPRQRFVLVGFSMGGLVSRAYLQDFGGAARCDGLVTISTPHHGTAMAALHYGKGAAEMRRGSDFLSGLAAGQGRLGKMPVVSYRTRFDLVVVPNRNSVWERADNVEIPCPLHPLMTCWPSVRADVLARFFPAAWRGE